KWAVDKEDGTPKPSSQEDRGQPGAGTARRVDPGQAGMPEPPLIPQVNGPTGPPPRRRTTVPTRGAAGAGCRKRARGAPRYTPGYKGVPSARASRRGAARVSSCPVHGSHRTAYKGPSAPAPAGALPAATGRTAASPGTA